MKYKFIMIMTPNMQTNSITIQRLDFHHQCEHIPVERLDLIVMVQLVMCLAIIWLVRRVKRLSPSCPQSNVK